MENTNTFAKNREIAINYLNGCERLYVVDGFAGGGGDAGIGSPTLVVGAEQAGAAGPVSRHGAVAHHRQDFVEARHAVAGRDPLRSGQRRQRSAVVARYRAASSASGRSGG